MIRAPGVRVRRRRSAPAEAATDNFLEAFRHLISGAARDIDPVVAEDRLLPERQQEIKGGDVLSQLGELDAIDGIEQLRVEIVNPELVEVAKDDEWRPLRNNVRPVIERLVIMLL